MPLFSVVIPAFNEEKLIQETIESVRQQSLSDLEIIVVDNGSTDDTIKVCKDADKVLSYTKMQNPSAVRNYGANNSNGIYIAFLDADSTLSPRALENAKKHLDNGFVGGTCIVTSPDKSLPSQVQMFILNNWAKYIGIQYTPYIVCTKDSFSLGGGWEEGKGLGDEIVFQRRLKKQGNLFLDTESFVETSPRRYHKEGFFKTTLLGALGYYGAKIKWRPVRE